MNFVFSATPWGLQGGEAQLSTLEGGSAGSWNVPGKSSPRLIVPSDVHPKYGGRNKLLPQVSFPFRWGDGKIYSSYQLPTDPKPTREVHELATMISFEIGNCEIIQTDIVGRPTQKYKNDFGLSVESFIDWQVHCFRELSDNGQILGELEEKSKNIIRRNWSAVRNVWIVKDDDEAMLSLIVELAQDKDLQRVLESIAHHPRHILLRHRVNTRLSRIQELDSVCIRSFAKQPGRTVYQKAGPRQELLAVQRVESKDTLENRVFSWVLNGMKERAWGYAATHAHQLESSRVSAVARCSRSCSEWAELEGIKDVSPSQLHHPVQPNYTLQMDSRYAHVYKTYRKLLKEQQVIDDSWEWQRNLWAESARQLMSCALTEFYPEKSASTPYYRMEGEYGIWSVSPISPGPFETKGGTCFVVDSRDVLIDWKGWIENPPFEFAPYVGSLGCDQVLFWPQTNTLLVVWFVYWTGSPSEISRLMQGAGLALRNLSADLRKYTRSAFRCFGVMLITENQASSQVPGVEISTWSAGEELELVGLRIPFAIDQVNAVDFKGLVEDFKAGIQLAIDMGI